MATSCFIYGGFILFFIFVHYRQFHTVILACLAFFIFSLLFNGVYPAKIRSSLHFKGCYLFSQIEGNSKINK